jgi:hypothetical protein
VCTTEFDAFMVRYYFQYDGATGEPEDPAVMALAAEDA